MEIVTNSFYFKYSFSLFILTTRNLVNYCNSLLKSDLIIYINTPVEIRYERILKRGKDRFKFTMEQFVAMDNLTKSTLKDYTPDLIIDNSTNDNIDEQIEKIMNFIKLNKERMFV